MAANAERGIRIRVQVLQDGRERWSGSFTRGDLRKIGPQVAKVLAKLRRGGKR
jgi:hypothetical protein